MDVSATLTDWSPTPIELRHGAGAVTAVAGRRTDLFADPGGADPSGDAPRCLIDPGPGDFLFSARVSAGLVSTFDAGALLVVADDDHWAKLALELSPAGDPTVVSVVTRGLSDDANGERVDGDSCWLRIGRIGSAIAFHHSVDGSRWDLVRYFSLGRSAVRVGVSVQSPTGESCTASFSHVSLLAATLAELRDGS